MTNHGSQVSDGSVVSFVGVVCSFDYSQQYTPRKRIKSAPLKNHDYIFKNSV